MIPFIFHLFMFISLPLDCRLQKGRASACTACVCTHVGLQWGWKLRKGKIIEQGWNWNLSWQDSNRHKRLWEKKLPGITFSKSPRMLRKWLCSVSLHYLTTDGSRPDTGSRDSPFHWPPLVGSWSFSTTRLPLWRKFRGTSNRKCNSLFQHICM